MPDKRRIAVVEGADSAKVQELFSAAVEQWCASGVNVVGVIEETHGLSGRTCNAGVLRDIATGETYSIYLEVPPENTSCHLDAAGATTAGESILNQIKDCDLVVLSKFGKLEAAEGGLRRAFEAAISAGKPVLTTVSEKHREAWRSFAPDAVGIAANDLAIRQWWASV